MTVKDPNRPSFADKWRARISGRRYDGECGRFTFAYGADRVRRTAILAHLATVYDYQSYLEIGVRGKADNFSRVRLSDKVGVDPDPRAEADFVMTSDEYFATHCQRRFDLIFIDGLHEGEQVARDIENSLRVLNPGGAVVLHDMNPPTAFEARLDYEQDGRRPNWCGDSWRGFVRCRATRPDLDMVVVDTDWGVGVVRHGRQRLYAGPWERYEDLAANRRAALNLITVRDFLRRHPARPAAWSPFDRLIA